MAIFTITREQILSAPLDEEEYALLAALVELDFLDNSNHYGINKHARPLIATRLQELKVERERLGLQPFDAGRAAEAEADLRAEMDDTI